MQSTPTFVHTLRTKRHSSDIFVSRERPPPTRISCPTTTCRTTAPPDPCRRGGIRVAGRAGHLSLQDISTPESSRHPDLRASKTSESPRPTVSGRLGSGSSSASSRSNSSCPLPRSPALPLYLSLPLSLSPPNRVPFGLCALSAPEGREGPARAGRIAPRRSPPGAAGGKLRRGREALRAKSP